MMPGPPSPRESAPPGTDSRETAGPGTGDARSDRPEDDPSGPGIGRLNHVALVVDDLAAASATWRDTLGAAISSPQALPEHGVTVVFVDLPNTRIELLEPLGDGSPVSRFLEKHRGGGMHHVCLEVADIRAARDRLVERGARVLGDGEPRTGAHGNPVLFLHPTDLHGTLVELEEVR